MVWEGVTLLVGEKPVEGAVPHPQINFNIYQLKLCAFMHSG